MSVRHTTCEKVRAAGLILVAGLIGLLTMAVAGASAVEFVTREQYRADPGPYHGLPLRILFRKFNESDVAARRAIREAIINQYAFDPNWQAGSKTAPIPLVQTFGVVHEIRNDTLILRDSAGGVMRTFHLGIDRIPVTGEVAGAIGLAEIRKSAVVVHTVDDRVYRLERCFALAEPRDLVIERRAERNLLTWTMPAGGPRPAAYQVLVNGRPAVEVDTTRAEISRSPGRIDAYAVVALYAYGDLRIPSPASTSVQDVETGRRMVEAQRAAAVWADIVADLTPDRWTRARDRLQAEGELLAAYLDPSQRTRAQALRALLAAVTEGDRKMVVQRLDSADIDAALQHYRQAGAAVEALAPDLDLHFLPRMKIEAAAALRQTLEAQRRAEDAEGLWQDVLARLKPGQWQAARADLIARRMRLTADLPPGAARQVMAVEAFFEEVDAARRMSEEAGRPEDFDRATAFLQRAAEKAERLKPELDLGFILDSEKRTVEQRRIRLDQQARRKDADARLAAFEQSVRVEQAVAIYDRLRAGLTPEGWTEARKLLEANRSLLDRHLDRPRRGAVGALADFFQAIDAGDRLAADGAAIEDLERAMSRYGEARDKAGRLAPALDAAFIVRLRQTETGRRLDRLKAEAKAAATAAIVPQGDTKPPADPKPTPEIEEALEVYTRLNNGLTPDGWIEARRLLKDKQALLEHHLDEARAKAVAGLAIFFRDIEAGDRLAAQQPETAVALESAAVYYEKARKQAEALAFEVDAVFIARLRQGALASRREALAQTARHEAILGRYREVAVGLTPEGWTRARDLLYANQADFIAELDGQRRADIQTLAGIFRRIDAGDQLAASGGASPADLKMARTLYQEANRQAQALVPRMDVQFLVRLRVDESDRRITALEEAARVQEARDVWRDIVAMLTPGQWEQSRDLLYARQAQIMAHLDEGAVRDAAQMEGFFRDIDQALRIYGDSAAKPADLELSLDYCRQAAAKAAVLSAGIDAGFIVKLTEKRIRQRIEVLTTPQAPAVALAPAPASVPILAPVPAAPAVPPPVQGPVSGATPRKAIGPQTPEAEILEQALQDLDRNDFTRAMAGFRHLYPRQIDAVQAPGKRRIQGLLGLPTQLRAEVVFAMEAEKRLGADGTPVREAMAELHGQIDNRLGFWAIISEAKRARLMQQLEGLIK